MPAGLQIFDANGVLQGDYTSNYGRHLGTIWTGDYPGRSVSDANLALGRPWAQAAISTGTFNWDAITKITVSGTTISWAAPVGSKNFYIIYGIY